MQAERLDLTEFLDKPRRGRAHIVTQAWERLEDVFIGLGFQVAEGPEVETDWHNFEALNMGEGHPARSDWDTLFVDHPGAAAGRTVLRTHTSPVQIRAMLVSPPPIYIVAPGRVFRRDTPDATHMPVFHQIEGLVVDRGITLAHLAGTIDAFIKAFFGEGFESRLRPSYFPFTEPSGEFDLRMPGSEWIELGGCGMVHPNVLRAGGVDPEEWSGFAFGFGIDRMARERHGVNDLREMFTGDMRFAEQFSMKVLLSWLREYVEIPEPVDLAALGDTLAMLGLPVEELTHTGGVAGVVTARVLRTEVPPDAAKVQRVWIDTGDGREHHVWCGAFNFGPGDLVPYAPIGTTLPDGRTLTRRAILGIDSEGMLCSARELELGDDHTGILVLPADAPLGVPYGEALGRRDDVILDLDVTRNRPDCQSYVGIARDLAAKLGTSFTPPDPAGARPPTATRRSRRPSTIVDGDRCGRFTSTVLSGVVVGPSAPWMAERLNAAGMRPINNVVDVSNYVMLELGQPNHAYDLTTLGGNGFRIRTGRPGETLTTLDDVERTVGAGRPVDLRRRGPPDRPRRDHGRRRHRDRRVDHHGGAGDGVVRAHRHQRLGRPPRAALGGVAPLRAGHRSVRDRRRHRPLRRAVARDMS